MKRRKNNQDENKKQRGGREVVARALQGVTNKLDAWAAERCLTSYPSKTVSMISKKRRKRNKETIKIMLRNKIIPSNESTQILGMTLD